MNRILRRTILKTLFEQEATSGSLTGHELLVHAPKNLITGISDLKTTCDALRQRRRVRVQKLAGVRGVFVANLTPIGRQAYGELDSDDALTLDILWVLNEVKRETLELHWGGDSNGLADQVVANLGQLLQIRDLDAIRRRLTALESSQEVRLRRDKNGRCVWLAISERGLRSLRERLSRL